MLNNTSEASFDSADDGQATDPTKPTAAQRRLEQHRSSTHASCVVCGSKSGHTPRVSFNVVPDGSVEATVVGGESYEGYAGLLHGGVIATLLDAAMTNCLFAQGHRAVTAELQVRYRHPVASRQPSHVRAWLERASGPLFVMQAELRQAGKLLVKATGKFMRIRADHPAETNRQET